MRRWRRRWWPKIWCCQNGFHGPKWKGPSRIIFQHKCLLLITNGRRKNHWKSITKLNNRELHHHHNYLNQWNQSKTTSTSSPKRSLYNAQRTTLSLIFGTGINKCPKITKNSCRSARTTFGCLMKRISPITYKNGMFCNPLTSSKSTTSSFANASTYSNFYIYTFSRGSMLTLIPRLIRNALRMCSLMKSYGLVCWMRVSSMKLYWHCRRLLCLRKALWWLRPNNIPKLKECYNKKSWNIIKEVAKGGKSAPTGSALLFNAKDITGIIPTKKALIDYFLKLKNSDQTFSISIYFVWYLDW